MIDGLWRRVRSSLDRPSPLVKQLPTALALALALLIIAWFPELGFSSPTAACSGIALVAAATALAVVLTVRRDTHHWLALLIPMIDIVGLGLFRAGTGGPGSLFASLLLLPVVWLAAAPGWLPVVIVGVLTSAMLFFPHLVQRPESGSEWLRGVVAPLVFASVAGVVNQLSRQQRLRTREAQALTREREEALAAQAESMQRLEESERGSRELFEMFRGLWDSSTEQAFVGTDRSGLVVAWNPGAERFFGLSEAEAVGRLGLEDVVPEPFLRALAADSRIEGAPSDPSPLIAAAVHRGVRALFAAADRGSAEYDADLGGPNGSLPARITVTPRRDEHGGRVGYLLVITDETHSTEVVRMKDEFIGMVSHELRTPLSSIVGFTDLLRNDTAQPLTEEQERFVVVIERNALRLLKLVGDLLLTAQVGAGRFPVDRVDTDLAAVVRASVESAGPAAERAGVRLEARLPAEPLRIGIDPQRMGQAIDNLLSNAVKFTPRGGSVTVSVQGGEEAVVRVRDSGIGIPEDERSQMFARFFRASTATRNAVPGVGLGLVITRAIVIAHGGCLTFESEEGVGTEFRIALPLAAE